MRRDYSQVPRDGASAIPEKSAASWTGRTETKELIAGYTIIRAESREEALEWTKRFPNPFPNSKESEIEVRAIKELQELGDSEAVQRFRDLGVGSHT